MSDSPNLLSIANEFEKKLINTYGGVLPAMKIRKDEIFIKCGDIHIQLYPFMGKIEIVSYIGRSRYLTIVVNEVRVETTKKEEYISSFLLKKYMELYE